MLEDVRIYFVHYTSFDEAKAKWNERCGRVNMEKLYFMMTERDGCTDEQIKRFDELPYEHKVIFTRRQRDDIPSSFYIAGSEEENGEVRDLCLYKSKFTGERWIDGFDYVGFLNEK